MRTLERAWHAVSALLIAASVVVVLQKLGRTAGQAHASKNGELRIAEHARRRAGATLGEIYSRKPRKGSGKGTLFENWTRATAWYVPFKSLPFTPLLTCEPGISLLMERFDWKLVPDHAWVKPKVDTKIEHLAGCRELKDSDAFRDNSHIADPRTVWAAPHALPRLLAAAERFDVRRTDRVVVFSGTEVPLSVAFGRSPADQRATVAKLQQHFSMIVYQVKDVPLEHVRVAPIGLSHGYTMMLLGDMSRRKPIGARTVAEQFLDLERLLNRGVHEKTRGLLALYGHVAAWLDSNHTYTKVEKLEREGRLLPPSNSSLKAVTSALNSRSLMRQWATSKLGQAVGVELRRLPQIEFWAGLAEYRFLLSPVGSAIQTAKTIEALFVLTVPIVQRMGFPTHDELADLGFPIVVVEAWTEITPNSPSRWWETLAPRLESFRRNCLSVEGYWRMYTSADRCT